jgi:hypothetical protein
MRGVFISATGRRGGFRESPLVVVGMIVFAGVAIVSAIPSAARAQVNVCQALTLYGNAVNTGLCKALSPGTQNLWVCDLAVGNPDVHSTFNATTALHITVRTTPPCANSNPDNSILAGAWPANLAIGAQQRTTICNVSIQNYVDRFNDVQRMAAGPATLCRRPFFVAQQAGKISHNLAQSYLNLCALHNCP